MDSESLRRRFESRKVVVIGDAIIDERVACEPIGLSLETPTMVVRRGKVTQSVGGAGLVAQHLADLGVQTTLVTLRGPDRWPPMEPLDERRVVSIVDHSRPTPRKTRFWSGSYKLFQVDDLTSRDIDRGLQVELLDWIEKLVRARPDLVVVADYRHGMLPASVSRRIVSACRHAGVPLLVNAQLGHRPSNLMDYEGAGSFMMNVREAEAVLEDGAAYGSIVGLLPVLRRKLNAANVVVTRGPPGSLALFEEEPVETSAAKVQAVDVCGAGDAFLAAWAAYGENTPDAMRFSNDWAGLATTLESSAVPRWSDARMTPL